MVIHDALFQFAIALHGITHMNKPHCWSTSLAMQQQRFLLTQVMLPSTIAGISIIPACWQWNFSDPSSPAVFFRRFTVWSAGLQQSFSSTRHHSRQCSAALHVPSAYPQLVPQFCAASFLGTHTIANSPALQLDARVKRSACSCLPDQILTVCSKFDNGMYFSVGYHT